MKKILLGSIVIMSNIYCNAQSAKLDWAKALGGNNNEQGNHVISDGMGFVYTVGSFMGTVDFDPGPGVFNLSATGLTDIFLMKQDPSGAFLWAKKYGGPLDDEATSIAIDPADNLYITGNFREAVNFFPTGPGGSVASNGDYDVFMLKLDRDGNFGWIRNMGGNAPDSATSNCWSNTGHIYTTGFFWNTADLNPGLFISNFTSVGLSDVYINKLDQFGNFVWTRVFGTDGMDKCNAITTDFAGNVYTIGTFSGSGDFNPSSGGAFKLGTNGLNDIFISKLNPLGGFVWAKQIGGTLNDIGKDIVVTDSGYIYITGSFSGIVDFNPDTAMADTFYMEAKGVNDMFVVKLNSNGVFLWAKNVGRSAAQCEGVSVDVDHKENVVIAGVFNDTMDFNPDTSSYIMNCASEGLNDIFVGKFDVNGDFMWAKRWGGTGADYCTSMIIDMPNNIYTTGYFKDSVDFNPAKEVFKLGSKGNNDAFIHKMSYCTPAYITLKDTFCSPFTLDGITYDKSGTYTQTVTGAGGCESFVSLTLDIRNINDTVSVSGVVLTAQATGVKYQWIGCDKKNEIPGATGKSYIALGNADYAVTLFDGKCRDTSECHTISSFPPLSVEEYAFQNAIQIFPNPSKGVFVIAIKESMIGATASIHNLLGQKVRDISLIDANTEQSLPAGFYLINISKGQHRISKRLIVE